MALLARLAELTFPQIPGGFEARIALLNDLSNGQQRLPRARGRANPPVVHLAAAPPYALIVEGDAIADCLGEAARAAARFDRCL